MLFSDTATNKFKSPRKVMKNQAGANEKQSKKMPAYNAIFAEPKIINNHNRTNTYIQTNLFQRICIGCQNVSN